MQDKPCALVIGLCSHGLAIARALHARGIEVHGFEGQSSSPGIYTKSATIHQVSSIKHDSLIEDLLAFRKKIDPSRKIVLFPTNDDNVRIIAENSKVLSELFLLSWQKHSAKVAELLLKSNIEKRCVECNIRYPRSVVIDEIHSIDNLVSKLDAPYIVKPIRPQAGFKAFKFGSAAALKNSMQSHLSDFPVIVQEWIPGAADDIYFCALYVDNGEALLSFVGRKLESYPPALGQTTVAVSQENAEVERLTKRFFRDLEISGPVSLELKKDHFGRYWVIEPTVGRTDFWLGLCVAGGVDLPFFEYQHVIGSQGEHVCAPLRPAVWFDSEKDTLAPMRYLYKWFNPKKDRFHPVFSYLQIDDMKPFIKSSIRILKRLVFSIRRNFHGGTARKEASAHQESSLTIISYPTFETVPQAFKELIEWHAEAYPFFDPQWFEIFVRHVARHTGSIEFLCLSNQFSQALSILPVWMCTEKIHGVNFRKITGLSNYYTPRYEIFCNEELCNKRDATAAFISHIRRNFRNWDVIDIKPIQRDTLESIRGVGWCSYPYYYTKNFTHSVNSSYSEYLDQRPPQLRNTINRKYRKLHSKEAYGFFIIESGDEVLDFMRDFHRVYTHSWKNKEPYPAFIDALVELAMNRGWLRLGQLTIGDKVVASQIWLVANQIAYIYKLAHDRNYAQFSPGTLLTCEILKYVIEKDNVSGIDFLHGSDAFKSGWMDFSGSLYGIQFPNIKSLRGGCLSVVNAVSIQKERWLRQKEWYDPGL